MSEALENLPSLATPLQKAGLTREDVETIVAGTLEECDDGELFIENRQSESMVFDDGKLKSAATDYAQGFGLRAVAGESVGYAHSSEISIPALQRANDAVKSVALGYTGIRAETPSGTNLQLYGNENPLDKPDFSTKLQLLQEIDAYARDRDVRVRQVTVSLSGNWQSIELIRPSMPSAFDIRPLVRFSISVVVEEGNRREQGMRGCGGREGYHAFIAPQNWREMADGAINMALINLKSVDAPAGEQTVVLGPGWPGILLHEAVGHGLEGDYNRKDASAFSGLMGKRVASPGVTVVDNGTIEARRGSLTIDDEGTPTSSTTLIEDGILVGYMQDRQNARLMGQLPTGNGRRESYAHLPMPRMTNTYMLSGEHIPEDIIKSVDKGLYAVSFGGGQVDITSGKFVFSCTEAYQIENGQIGLPVKGATLIGNGPEALTRVAMIGNDMELDPGIGTCGKNGQGVPVGVGQPTIRIDQLTVGGTAS
jgi:TldD protein